jgi:ubiquitin C-terminal hydrolase
MNYKGVAPNNKKDEYIKINGKKYDRTYKLISSIKFSGSSQYGHYTTYRIHNKKWYVFNDSLVEGVHESEVLDKRGCILLY